MSSNQIKPFIDNIQQRSGSVSSKSKVENTYCEFIYNNVDDIENETGFQSFMAKLLKDVKDNNKKIDVLGTLETPYSSKTKQESLFEREGIYNTKGGKKKRTVVKRKRISSKTKRRR
jgi:hypothetical protein